MQRPSERKSRLNGSILQRLKANELLFAGKKVLVVGDIALDLTFRCTRAREGEHARHASESIFNVLPDGDDHGAVGASNNNCIFCRSMGSQSQLITMTGSDPEGERVAEILAASGISARQLRVQGVQTVTRYRFLIHNPGTDRFEFLYRFDKDPDPSSYARAEEAITRDGFLEWFEGEAETADVILFNDTEKGFLSRGVLVALDNQIRTAGERRESNGLNRPIVIVDPKIEWEKYQGLTVHILKPNHIEACTAAHLPELDFSHGSNLMKLWNRLYARYKDHFPHIVVTLGALGSAVINCDGPIPTLFRHPAIPAMKTAEGVATHCGDMFASALALSLAVDSDLPRAIDFANCVGSLQFSMRAGEKVTRSDLTTDAFVEHVRANYASHRLVSNVETE